MENFRTTFPIDISKPKISYQSPIMLVGSCFSENFGKLMLDNKFDVYQNPCGIAFNPESVSKSIEFLLDAPFPFNKALVENNNLWHSIFHHGSFSKKSRRELEDSIRESISRGTTAIQNAKFLFLTFGTAWYYKYKKTDSIVSNCHKIPNKEFEKRLFTIDEIVSTYSKLIPKIRETNPDIEIVFTVSPVRHLGDGAHNNLISKSTLVLAIEKLISKFDHCSYFPAYEIVIDDLRDYRFFAEDLVHINKTAISYIWKIFLETYMQNETRAMIGKVENIMKAMTHRPLDVESAQYKNFLVKIRTDILSLDDQIPTDRFKKELEYIDANT